MSRTGEMRYFDSRDMPLDVQHVMASGALPPAFPAVRIDGELYWDGGILSNTPVEAVFDDNPRRNSLIFAVHIWNPHGPEPDTIWQVMNRQKDIQYSSRAVSHIARQKQIHRLRHVIAELASACPRAAARSPEVERAGGLWLPHPHARRSPARAVARRRGPHQGHRLQPRRHPQRAARPATPTRMRVLEHAPWSGDFDPIEGFILHEARPGTVMTAA